MSHQPPDIIDTEVDPSTWAVTVKWQVDPILHGEVPDTVDSEVDGGSLKTGLPGSTTEYTIDGALAHNLPGPELGITVDFVWSEDMNPQQSSVLLQWPPQASTQPPQGYTAIPTVNVNG